MIQIEKMSCKVIFYILVITVTRFKYTYGWCQQCEEDVEYKNPDIPIPCSDQFEIITDLTHEDCDTDYFYAENENCVHSCFPRCLEKCGPITPCGTIKCPPGYHCQNEDDPCQPDKQSCFKYVHSPNPRPDGWIPNCFADGTWEAKQCKGEQRNGRCFCFDAVGNRIFGHEFSEKADNMTCACSRKRTELMNSGSHYYSSLHCDTMGNYEPLQCDNGLCWCVKSQTGEITANVVPEKMMQFLPCYSKKDVGEQYLRQCESEEFAQRKILHELNVHGTKYANFHHILCDADGTYGAYQVESGNAYCKWKDNSNIGSYQTTLSETPISSLNCNCARDKKIYEEAGIPHTLVCEANGNYRLKQILLDGRWFCIDTDGFRITDYFSDEPDDCNIYLFY